MRPSAPAEAIDWAEKRLGVDVARFGDDRTVIFPRQGICAFQPIVMRHARGSSVSVDIASRVMAKKLEWGGANGLEFFDDTVGWAHGAVDVMRAAGHSPYAIQFDKPSNNPRYANMRAECWMKMSDWVKASGCLPNLPELIGELTAPTYFFNKADFRSRQKTRSRSAWASRLTSQRVYVSPSACPMRRPA